MSIPSQDYWGAGLYQIGGEVGIRTWDDALSGAIALQGGRVLGQEYLMRRMMRLEPVASVDRIYRNVICEGTLSVSAAVPEPLPGPNGEKPPLAERQKHKRAEEALAFTNAWVARLPFSLKSLCHDLLEADAFGHKLAEIDWQPITIDEPAFRGETWIAPADVAPKPRTAYAFKVDGNNIVQGVYVGGRLNEDSFIPASNVVVHTVGGSDRNPYGGGILPTLWKVVQGYERDERNQDKASDQTGGGFIISEHEYKPDGSWDATIEVPAPNGEKLPDGSDKLIRVSKMRVTAAEIAKASTGKAASTPPGVKTKPIQADGAQIFGQFLDRRDRAIARAWFGSARMLTEAQNASKADTGEAADVGETARDASRGRLKETIENQLFLRALRLNFGNEYDDVVPVFSILTEEGDEFAMITATMVQPGFAALPTAIKTFIGKKAGFPDFPEQEEPQPDSASGADESPGSKASEADQ
jgi:hypothetical protein